MLRPMFGRLLLVLTAGTFAAGIIVPRMFDAGSAGLNAPAPAASSAAGTAPTPAAPSLRARAEIPRDADGHFRASVLINGHPLTMVVDTGASMVALPESAARAAGIAVPPPDAWNGRVMTANGETSYAPVRIASISIDGVERIDIEGAVLRDAQLSVPLLGQTYMNALAEVSIVGDKMRIR